MDSRDLKCTPYLFFLSILASIATFNVGFNTGVINISQKSIQCNESTCVPMNDLVWGLVVGLFSIGGGIGGLLTFNVYNYFSRLQTLFLIDVVYLVGGIILATSNTVVQLAIGRIIVGVSSGASGVLVSNYIAEISTVKLRGFLGAILQVMLASGILTSQVISMFLSSGKMWKILLGLTCVPAVLQMIFIPFMPESPVYLLSKGKETKAQKNLQKVRGDCVIEDEFESLTTQNDKTEKSVGIMDILKPNIYTKYILITIFLHASQQLCFINGFLYYSSSILKEMFNQDNADYITIGISIILLVSSVTCSLLMDKVGRRFLLLFGISIQVITSLCVFIGSIFDLSILVGISVLVFVFAFAVGLGTIPWVIVGDYFPGKFMTPVSSVAIAINWISNFIVAFIFPYYNKALKKYTFLPITIIIFVMLLVVFFFVPETKGKNVPEMINNLENNQLE